MKTELNPYFFPTKMTWAETREQKMKGSQPRHKGPRAERERWLCWLSTKPLELFCPSVMDMYALISLHSLVVNWHSPLVRRATVVCSWISLLTPHSCRTHSLECSALLFMASREFWPSASEMFIHSRLVCTLSWEGRVLSELGKSCGIVL